MRRLLDLVYLAALTVLFPWLCWRAWRTKRYRAGLRDKLLGWSGQAPLRPVWFHAVSLGEIKVLGQFIPEFRQRHPQRHCVVSSTTDTGLEEARRLFPDLLVFPFPFDFSWAVERTLRRIAPELIVLCESELWPNFLLTANQLRIPVAVINGRMSPRSLARYHLVAPLVRKLFRLLEVVGVQTEEHMAAMLTLGVIPGRVRVTGNIKYDGARTERHNPHSDQLRQCLQIQNEDLIWVAGSTQAPEEEIVLDLFIRARHRFPRLRLLLVPRQRDRFDEVARLIERKGVAFVRRSALPCTLAPVVLIDSIGELAALWGLADLAFVGGSLDGKRGGQNMIEPAGFAAAVTFGPHVWNFRRTAEQLVACGGAYQVRDAAELEAVTLRLLADAAERQAAGQQARRFVLAQQGATKRTLDLLGGVLRPRSDRVEAA